MSTFGPKSGHAIFASLLPDLCCNFRAKNADTEIAMSLEYKDLQVTATLLAYLYLSIEVAASFPEEVAVFLATGNRGGR